MSDLATEGPSVRDIYRRIIAASIHGRGIRLSVDEVQAVVGDDAIRRAAGVED